MEKAIEGALDIRPGRETARVNPMLFGHFIEFMYDCIDDGMWAQLLHNRGFEGAPLPGGTCAPWEPTGMLNHFSYALDEAVFYGREGHAQRITAENHYGNGWRGIAQGGLRLFAGQVYDGSVWLKAAGPVRASLLVHDEDAGLFCAQEFSVAGEWTRCEISFTAPLHTRTARFEVRLHGNGTLWVDQASLTPQDAVHGVWKNVIAAVRELHPPVIRFPGGCFADCYHWRDGVGPRDERPVRPNAHWGGLEDNSFGTDEYMAFCYAVGCEPMICVNFGTGTAQEAADWVEYCNGGTDTPMGRLRAENGHPQPYGVKYWDIGNETFGDWEIGHCGPEEYARRYMAFTQEMKRRDASIQLLACGGDANYASQEWNRTILTQLGAQLDVLCLHMYPPQIKTEVHENRDIYHAVVGAVAHYERVLCDTLRVVKESGSRARVGVTEWNAGYNNNEAGREQTMEAAVFCAGLLIMFLRHSADLAVCNYSDLVNGWGGGCIRSKDGQTYGTASYHVLKLFAAAGLSRVVEHTLETPVFATTTRVGNVLPEENIPWLDAVCAVDEQGRTVAYVVNRHMELPARVRLTVEGSAAQSAACTVITAPLPSDYNTAQNEHIRAAAWHGFAGGVLTLPPHSVVKVEL